MGSDNHLNRRHFLKMTSIAAATTAAGVMPVGNARTAPRLPRRNVTS